MAETGAALAGLGPRPARLKRRSEFLNVARGTRVHAVPFSLQARLRDADVSTGAATARIGLTVTKKTGNAVERNRVRRRLREALRRTEALSSEPDTDYVLVARREALSLPFTRLIDDLGSAVRRAGAQLRKPRGPGKPPRSPKP